MPKQFHLFTALILAVTLSFGQNTSESRLISSIILQQKQLFIDDTSAVDSILYTVPMGNYNLTEQNMFLTLYALDYMHDQLEIAAWEKLGLSEKESKKLAEGTSLSIVQRPTLKQLPKGKVTATVTDSTAEATIMQIEMHDISVTDLAYNSRYGTIIDDRRELGITEIPKTFSATLYFKITRPSVTLNIDAMSGKKAGPKAITANDHLVGYFTKIEITDMETRVSPLSSEVKTDSTFGLDKLSERRVEFAAHGIGLDMGWWRNHPRFAPLVQLNELFFEIRNDDDKAVQTFGFIDGTVHVSFGVDPDDKRFMLNIPVNATFGGGSGYKIFSLGAITQEGSYNFSSEKSHMEGLFRGGFSFGVVVPWEKKKSIMIHPLLGWYIAKNKQHGVFKPKNTLRINNIGGHMELLLDKHRVSLDYSRLNAHNKENQTNGIGHIIQGRYNYILKNSDIINLSVKSNYWDNDVRDSHVDVHVSYIKAIF